jgi:peptidoglycan/xylan/chitin deacetylase (PgdA/CDA1 family)
MTSRAVPVLMYHRINSVSSDAMRKFTVAPEDFDAQLRWLRHEGYTGLTVSEFAKCSIDGAHALPARPIVLTFDDGFSDFAEQAAPILRRHGFVATLYVVAGLVGGASTWLDADDAQLPLLDWAMLRQLQSDGIEIGAHGMSHRALDGLSDLELRTEISEPIGILSQQLGAVPQSFCYPFGFRNERVRQHVREAGYSSACAVRYATSSITDDRFDIARHIVPGGMKLDLFSGLASGKPPLIPLLRDRARSQAGFLARQLVTALHR